MATIKWTQGDSAPDQPFIIKQNRTALNLTGASVKFKIGRSDTLAQINAGHDTCTITSATLGAVTYPLVSSDTATAGSFTGELEVTFSTGKVQSTGKVDIQIDPQVV